ncbi:hypothetical protein EVA_11442 [gut metagenome]|uniref:Uncharacterized protein n=1 Tax=gut metagenome TaxID=749906 RepID=J9FZM9_9ZZZZ
MEWLRIHRYLPTSWSRHAPRSSKRSCSPIPKSLAILSKICRARRSTCWACFLSK